MIKSMTGFAHTSGEFGGKRIDLEIRSVNHRFLDVQFKMPEDLRYLEGAMREQIAQYVTRGKLECRIQLNNVTDDVGSLHINQQLVHELAMLNEQWRNQYDGLGKLTVAEILKFPNVIISAERDTEALAVGIHELLNRALHDFVETRKREGYFGVFFVFSGCLNVILSL